MPSELLATFWNNLVALPHMFPILYGSLGILGFGAAAMSRPPGDEHACLKEGCARWRAREKVKAYGAEALLDLDEAASVIDVSPSQFERLGIPCVPWSARGRRWRYGAITARARQLEEGAA